MRAKRPLSAGTILMLVFTAVVLMGSLILYARITDPNAVARVNAQAFADTLSAVRETQPPTSTATPAPTIRTTVVNVEAPASAQSAEPTPDPAVPTAGAYLEAEQTSQPDAAVPANARTSEHEAEAAAATVGPARAVTLTAAGMVCIQSDITEAALAVGNGSADYSGLLDAISEYVAGDMRIVPFEGLLTGTAEKYGDVLTLPGAASAVKAGGFDTVLLNHAHVLDFGVDAAQKTADAFRGAGVSAAGIYVNGARADIADVGGVRTAVLAYTSVMSGKTKEQLKTSPDTLNVFNIDEAVSDIKAARENGAELVVVCLHWGKTDANGVTNAQREAAKKMAAAGADVILGANSEAVLPLEIIETGDRKTFVAYSLGTLLSESRSARAVISGMVLNIRLLVYDSGRVRIDEVRYTPTYVWKQKIDGRIRFAVLPSAAEAPAQMTDDQKKNMANALKLIDKMMANGPAKR